MAGARLTPSAGFAKACRRPSEAAGDRRRRTAQACIDLAGLGDGSIGGNIDRLGAVENDRSLFIVEHGLAWVVGQAESGSVAIEKELAVSGQVRCRAADGKEALSVEGDVSMLLPVGS